MDRDFLDRLALVTLYAQLAYDADPDGIKADVADGVMLDQGIFDNREAGLAVKLHYATWPADPNDRTSADPADVNAGLRAFDAVSAGARQVILNGWPPIDADRRPRGVDVLASLAATAPLSRVLVLAIDKKRAEGDGPPTLKGRTYQAWLPLASPHAVRLVVREGTPRDLVNAALEMFRFEVEHHWNFMVRGVPTGVFRRRRGQVWKAYDKDTTFDGYLVTTENDINRPIAYVCPSNGLHDMSHADAEGLAEIVAAAPSRAVDPRVIDLRAYGYEDSRLATPAFLYGLRCEPLTEDREPEYMVSPRPFCRFMLQELREREANVPRADAPDL